MALVIPLSKSGRVLGVIGAGTHQADRVFGEHEREQARRLASLAAAELDQALTQETALRRLDEQATAGLISRVDTTDEKVHVDRTKHEIKDSPEFDESSYRESTYRDSLGDYYGRRTV